MGSHAAKRTRATHWGEVGVLVEEVRDCASIFAEWSNKVLWEIFLAWVSVYEEWESWYGHQAD